MTVIDRHILSRTDGSSGSTSSTSIDAPQCSPVDCTCRYDDDDHALVDLSTVSVEIASLCAKGFQALDEIFRLKYGLFKLISPSGTYRAVHGVIGEAFVCHNMSWW